MELKRIINFKRFFCSIDVDCAAVVVWSSRVKIGHVFPAVARCLVRSANWSIGKNFSVSLTVIYLHTLYIYRWPYNNFNCPDRPIAARTAPPTAREKCRDSAIWPAFQVADMQNVLYSAAASCSQVGRGKKVARDEEEQEEEFKTDPQALKNILQRKGISPTALRHPNATAQSLRQHSVVMQGVFLWIKWISLK